MAGSLVRRIGVGKGKVDDRTGDESMASAFYIFAPWADET